MTDERDTPASRRLAGKRRASRKRPEFEVDRAGLAEAVTERLAELSREGVTRQKVAQRAPCSTSALRHMQNGTGTSHYGHELLTRVARGLGLPEDRLVKAFYPPVPRGPEALSEAEAALQRVLEKLDPYLAKINAIPGIQKDVEGLQERLNDMASDVRDVKSRLEILVDISYPPPAG